MVRLVLLGVAWVCLSSPSAAQASGVSSHGYLATPDGMQLRYIAERPGDVGRFPTVMMMDYYAAGTAPTHGSEKLMAELVRRGYAVVGVSVRGTGCSSGTFDLFDPIWARDAYQAVEWAGTQAWSTGRVGMVGVSSAGLLQLFAASGRPPQLAAILPAGILGDVYRDVAFPGGIPNSGFAAIFSAGQPELGIQNVDPTDPECVQNVAAHPTTNASTIPSEQLVQHPFRDPFWQAKATAPYQADINVPTLLLLTWEDEQVGPQEAIYAQQFPARSTWIIGSNGSHTFNENSALYRQQAADFLDHFVAGKSNEWDQAPRVQIWHESNVDQGQPRWITALSSWPPKVTPAALYLRSDGRLSSIAPGRAAATRSYAYPRPSSAVNVGDSNVPEVPRTWTPDPSPDGRLNYTTPALSRNVSLFGTASLDLWFSSTAPDTDIQATLSEVRPDGQEMYVARGWLRASHRLLVPQESTSLLPVHADTEAASRPLTPGRFVLLRLEIMPFQHLFRKGSSLRITIESPLGATGVWSLNPLITPATNTIASSQIMPSRLLVGEMNSPGAVLNAFPTCGTVLFEPCRANATPVPSGSESMPELNEISVSSPATRCARTSAVVTVPPAAWENRRNFRLFVNGHRVHFRSESHHRLIIVLPAGRQHGIRLAYGRHNSVRLRHYLVSCVTRARGHERHHPRGDT